MDETKKARLLFSGIIMVALIAGAGGTYAAQKYLAGGAEVIENTFDPKALDTTEEIISAVGRLIVLPEGEIPTVATVTNPDQLKDQPFFANARVGYKVLIYTQARKGILYDPLENKIIDVSILNISASPTEE